MIIDLDRLGRVYVRRTLSAMTHRRKGPHGRVIGLRNCIVLGSARSGTSMVAGTMRGLG